MNPLELQNFPYQRQRSVFVIKTKTLGGKGRRHELFNTPYDFHEPGMKATKEFGAFLKEIGRG